MKRAGRRIACALAIVASASACRRESAPSRNDAAIVVVGGADAAPSDRAHPIVVTVVVDQLAAWIAAERIPQLPPDGGFQRLMREGTYVRALRYAHAVTDTAPGHASLYTGAVPREHGIFGNELVTATRDVVSVLRDESTQVVYPNAIEPPASSSPARLLVPTVADALRVAAPDALVISLSLKDRGALIPGGKTPSAAVWLDTKQARFVTSTAVAKALPGWVEAHGDQASVLRALGVPWERTVDAGIPSLRDDQSGEGDESGLGRTFPHRLDAVTSPARVFRTLPAADETLFALAVDALAAEKLDEPRKVMLALSLSANDYVGHVFGPDSLEAWEVLWRLDRALASFMRELDRRFGERGWSMVLAADHGVTSMPEVANDVGARPWCKDVAKTGDRWQRPCRDPHRVDLEDMSRALIAAAERALPGKADLVRGTADPYVFVGDGARALSVNDRAKLDRAIRGVLEKIPGVRRVFAVDALPPSCPPLAGDDALTEDARIEALVCRSVSSTREHVGAYYVVLQPGSFFDPRIVRGFGTSHGSPYLYDRTVPMFVRGRAARRGTLIEEPVDFRAFARTAAGLLGVEAPLAARDGRDLSRR